MAQGKSCRAIAVLAGVLQKKSPTGPRRCLVHVDKTVIAVARQQFDGDQRVTPDSLLPPRAAGREARLPQPSRGHRKLADCRSANRYRAGSVEKSVDLLLVERLLDDVKIQRSIVNAPAEGEFRIVVAERQHIAGQARLEHGALRKTVPVRTQARLQNDALCRGPRVLRITARLRGVSLRD